MEFQKGVDESSDAPAVPEKIRAALHKNLHGLHAIIVEEEAQQGRFKKLNRIRLDNKGGDFPDEDIEEICEAVMRVIDLRDKQREEGDAPVNFRIVFERKAKDGKRTRPSVEYTYIPDGGPDDEIDPESYYSDPRVQIMEEMREYQSRLHYHLDEAHTMIREIANNNQQSIKPIMDALGWMGHFYAMGLQNQQVALSMIYDIKKVEIQEQHADARVERWTSMLKKPLSAFAGQIARLMGKKFGGGKAPADEPEDSDEPDDSDENEGAPAQGQARADDGEEDVPEEAKRNPLAYFAQACATQIRPDQWFDLAQALTKRELGLLRAVLLAETDETCIDAYDEFSELPVDKLMKLNDVLDEEQRGHLEKLAEIVEAAKKHHEKN